MASLRDIRKRIKSVKSTRQITKAMKMVAAAKLRKAQEAALATRPYGDSLRALMAALVRGLDGADDVLHPLMVARPVKRIDVVVVTSDRGLAGGYNANVMRQLLKFLKEEGPKVEKIEIVTIGRKAGDFLRSRGLRARKDWTGLLSRVSFASATEVAEEVSARFLKGETDAVYTVSTFFKSAIAQEIRVNRLFPISASEDAASGQATGSQPVGGFEFEPDARTVLNELVPRSAAVAVYRMLMEAAASEHGARMTAMENATKAAGDMIGTLTLFYNRTRQAVITKELMEIVSGAEALKG